MEIHICGIDFRPVSHDPSLMLHPEILYLVPHFFQLLSQTEDIGFRASVGMQKFVNYQYLHLYSPP